MQSLDPIELENYLIENLARTVVAVGIDLVKNEACDLLMISFKAYCKHLSEEFCSYINSRATDIGGDKALLDIKSQAISEGASIQAITVHLLAREVERGEHIDFYNRQRISCVQAAKYLFHLGRCYEHAVTQWKDQDKAWRRNKKFQRKRKSRIFNLRNANLKKAS